MELLGCPRFERAQDGLDLAPHLLDGAEVGGIGRQEHDPRAAPADDPCDARALVGGEVVGEDDVPAAQRGREHPPDVGLEDVAVRGAVRGHAGGGAVQADGRDHRARRPVAVRRGVVRAFTFGRPAVQARHVRLRARLVNKHEGIQRQPRHARLPFLARPAHVFAVLPGSAQRFFL